jgi:hypothetical protein
MSSFFVVTGDRIENEQIYKLYLKRSGSGIANLRLDGYIEKPPKKEP